MRQVDLFEWYLDKIFEDGQHVTKAKILDAFHKANPESLSLVKNLDMHFVTQRSELLIGFMKDLRKNGELPEMLSIEKRVANYLANL